MCPRVGHHIHMITSMRSTTGLERHSFGTTVVRDCDGHTPPCFVTRVRMLMERHDTEFDGDTSSRRDL